MTNETAPKMTAPEWLNIAVIVDAARDGRHLRTPVGAEGVQDRVVVDLDEIASVLEVHVAS